jgi:lipid II:glycine glycyltransferase (peptidoglycan interpeptide bridge formation enzyme)
VPGVTAIAVRTISAAEHLAFIDSRPSASFLQTPAWGAVKTEWRSESIGWFEDARMVGAGLVLYRQLPRVRRFLAYLPEGPVLNWDGPGLDAALTAMAAHLREAGAFGVRMGPPVAMRSWHADTVKAAIADPATRRLADVQPDRTFPAAATVEQTLLGAGWRRQRADGGFGAGQPPFVFQLPLRGRTPDEVLAGMNQLWRRNIKKASKAGVVVARGDIDDLGDFHRLYTETAHRDAFNPRPLGYFRQMFEALLSEDPDRIRLYLARHEADLVAATTWVKVGTHTWYSYGASSGAKREVRGSNAIQWRMITDALDANAEIYDLRGITDTVDPADPHIGLVQFKVGTGGEVVEYLGEWDLPLNRLLYAAFDVYMSRRSGSRP